MSDEQNTAAQLPAVSINPPPIIAPQRAVQRLNVTGAAFVGTSFKSQMETLRADLARLPEDLAAAMQKMSGAAQMGKNIVASINADADDLAATLGQFTNEQG